MALLHTLLNITNFRSPLLRTIVPSVATAIALQTAVAVPSVAFQTERFYDLSGSLTYLAVGALSLYLPALRARSVMPDMRLPSLLAPFKAAVGGGAGVTVLGWRQVLLTGAVTLWAMRRESSLHSRFNRTTRTDSRPQSAHISSSAF